MKKEDYSHIEISPYRKNFILFIETLEEVLFYYSFESYKLPALNSHFLCLDMLQTKVCCTSSPEGILALSNTRILYFYVTQYFL